jgi:two-component system response regulator LytT
MGIFGNFAFVQILIVEDEKWAFESLSEQLTELFGNRIIIEGVTSVRDATQHLHKHKVDLVFMDIHLADGLSFDIFKKAKVEVPVIFTTAYDNYALEAFKNQGYAYLLKPFELEDLQAALAKVDFVFAKAEEPVNYKSRFLVKFGHKMKTIAVQNIAFFMADDKILFGYTFEGDQVVIDDTLSSLMPKLTPESFFQINRKFIININAIQEMVKIARGRIKLNMAAQPKDLEIVVSEDRSTDFQNWLNS